MKHLTRPAALTLAALLFVVFGLGQFAPHFFTAASAGQPPELNATARAAFSDSGLYVRDGVAPVWEYLFKARTSLAASNASVAPVMQAQATLSGTIGFTRHAPDPNFPAFKLGPRDVRSLNLETNEETIIRSGSQQEQNQFARLSPDGTKVVYRSNSALVIADADGTNPVTIPNQFPGLAGWSPDSQHIIYPVDGDRLYMIDANGQNKRLISWNRPAAARAYNGSAPTWSPGGTKIFYGYYVPNPTTFNTVFDIAVLTLARNQDGTFVLNSDGSIAVTSDVLLTGESELDMTFPAVSPDGTKIAFDSCISSPFTECAVELFLMNADGTNIVNLTNTQDYEEFLPVWSPDGTRIAFTKESYNASRPGEIIAIKTDGTDPIRIPTGTTHDRIESWIDPCTAPVSSADSSHASKSVKSANQTTNTPRCPSKEIIVNNTTDDPDKDPDDTLCDTDGDKPGLQCSLRAAIQTAEGKAHPGRDTIKFDIPGGGVHTIAPTTEFKSITQPLTIDGTSQPGYNGSPLIELSGANIPEEASPVGLDFQSGSGFSRVEGLALHSWLLASIGFLDSENSQVVGCYIGLRANGVTAPPNQFRSTAGIWVNAKVIQIQGNVISHNEIGIRLGVAYQAIILNNKIGTDKTGLNVLPNHIGIEARNGFAVAEQGFHQIEQNLISGNADAGISIGVNGGGGGTRFYKNLIGTTPDGLKALPNGNCGIRIADSSNNVIEGNTISGHAQDTFSAGIFLKKGAETNQIYDNKIGIGADGTTVIPNTYGIIIERTSLNQIGVAGKLGNKISGNREAAIYITEGNTGGNTAPFPATRNTIINNQIGITSGNKDGIRLDSGAKDNEISGNSISGNASHGVLLLKDADNNQIHDNQIGTLGANKVGVGIKSSNNSIYKNTISGNTDYNLVIGYIDLDGSISGTPPTIQENKVYDNLIEKSKIGLAISDLAKNNRIGVDGPNKIINHKEGAGVGIYLGGAFGSEDFIPSGNEFYRNRIGEVQPGSFSNKVGMVINNAKNNIIGSATSGLGNLFLASAEDGIIITGGQTTGNQIGGNFIGFDLASPGVSASGNGGNGILVDGAPGNQIIKNRIGYNLANGIRVTNLSAPTEDAVTITIAGNDIGVVTPANQTLRIANGADGIELHNVQNALIGNESNFSPERNVIAANVGSGISIIGANSSFNRISHTNIGTPVSLGNFGNGGDGIRIIGLSGSVGRNIIGGGSLSGLGNVIVFNGRNGISVENSFGNKIHGNFIGTYQNVKAGNGLNGISIFDSGHTEIGQRGFTNNLRNMIGGNGGSGILLEESAFTKIESNYIGTNPSHDNLGNDFHGVLITDGTHSTNVGGRGVETGNTIAFNINQRRQPGGFGGGGVVIDSTAGRGNLVDPNQIFNNEGMGIEIGGPGLNPNDFGDADEGPNRLQNHPEIISRRLNSNNEFIVSYRVTSALENSNYGTEGIYVEFFRTDAAGEGEKFLGFDHYTVADYADGAANPREVNLGNITALGINPTDRLTASATDADGNTSEFFGDTGGLIAGADGSVQFAAAAYTVNESAGTLTVTVTRTGPANGAVTASYSTTPGTATADDYTHAAGSVTFADGDLTPKTFDIQITNDSLQEPEESFKLTLSITNGSAAPGTPAETLITITDDDAEPTPTPTPTPTATPTPTPTPEPVQLVISQFRENGPNGPTDEFVEIFNPTSSPHTVLGSDDAGYGVFASAGNGTTSDTVKLVCVIPEGTVIPALGYFLCTGTGYSLGNLGINGGAAGATSAGGDVANVSANMATGASDGAAVDIPNDAGLALISVGTNVVTSTGGGLAATGVESITVFDKVGFAAYGPAAPGGAGRPPNADNFCETNCLQPVGNAGSDANCAATGPNFPAAITGGVCYGQSGQYTILRKQLFTTLASFRASGTIPQDTNINADDFLLLAPNPSSDTGMLVTNVAGVNSIQGAASPHNGSAPSDAGTLAQAPFDSAVAQLVGPNAERNFVTEDAASGPAGTYILRLRYTNVGTRNLATPTGANVVGGVGGGLRFRIDILSTLCGAQASPATNSVTANHTARNLRSPGTCNEGSDLLTAILKAVSSTGETIQDTSGTPTTIRGTVVEDIVVGGPAPGGLSPIGGGINNSLVVTEASTGAAAGNFSPGTISPGDFMFVKFKFGVVKGGRFIVLFTPEASSSPTP